MSHLKQRGKAAAASSSSSSSSSDAAVATPLTVAPSLNAAAAAGSKHSYSESSYDYVAGVGSAREVAAAIAASKRSGSGGSALDSLSGGSESVFHAALLLPILVLAFMVRLFSVLRYESVIHEFDPWFNFRTTRYLVEEGFYAFHNWVRRSHDPAAPPNQSRRDGTGYSQHSLHCP